MLMLDFARFNNDESCLVKTDDAWSSLTRAGNDLKLARLGSVVVRARLDIARA